MMNEHLWTPCVRTQLVASSSCWGCEKWPKSVLKRSMFTYFFQYSLPELCVTPFIALGTPVASGYQE